MTESLKLGFVYTLELIDAKGHLISAGRTQNLIPQVGIDYWAGLLRGTTTPIGNWYVGVFSGNYVPVRGNTAADLPGTVGEAVGYSQATRPKWDNVYDGTANVDSLDSPAEFTFPTATRLYGTFLVSNSSKGSNTGTLLSIARFSSPYDVPAGSTFKVGTGISLATS